MSAYMGAEDGTSVTVCAELSNVLPMSGTTADISTSFVVTDGDAGKSTVKMKGYLNPSLVTIVAAQCLLYGKQRMCTQVQPTLTLLVS